MATGRFSWQEHGPKDYAEACYTLAMDRRENREDLNGTERSALEHILNLFSKAAQANGGRDYLTFSRAWLADVLQRSVRQVGRVLSKLRRCGYIIRHRRDPVGTQPQTALTRAGAKLLSLLYRTAGLKPQRNGKRTLMSHKDLKKGNRSESPSAPISPSSVEMKLSASAAGVSPLQGDSEPSAEPETKPQREEALKIYTAGIEQIRLTLEAKHQATLLAEQTAKSQAEERRIELRRQAELLKARGD